MAQFVTVLAMVSNDWLRLMADMEDTDAPGPEGRRHEILNYRLQAALHYEAALFFRDASRETQIRESIATLPEGARDDYESVLAGLGDDPETAHRGWFEWSRNRTFHYSRVGRRQPIRRALAATGDETGALQWRPRFGDRRFLYADQVVLEWLPSPSEQEDRLSLMAASVMALARFCQAAVGTYLVDRGVLTGSRVVAFIGRRAPERWIAYADERILGTQNS